ncbi:Uu.00g112400.m01.CDS01 [Anthostomella pinea]|uniref:Uu.00g112400.m01.CDS01 n=1 Tax=Anthostomella pinea TaxID=933095 RepID=A0AAI8VFS8_9PEZI|nr:Uu.00g112400.m01.CDS01 [Anthostomella pinea]
MDRIAPEILYIVCSFLSVDDIINFRLVTKSFADIGAAYMLPEVTFFMHGEELERLRAISLHPVFSRNICSLTYFAQALDYPKVSFHEFRRDHKRELRWNSKLKKLNLSFHQLMDEYRKYESAADEQTAIMNGKLDIQVLQEVLPRLTSLQRMTMSAGNIFYEGRVKKNPRHKPMEDIMRGNNSLAALNPEGARPLEALLKANADVKCALKSLRAGTLHWRFFKRSAAELMRMFKPLSGLWSIEFIISVEPADERRHESNSAGKCRRVLAKGALRNIFKSMTELRSLCVEIDSMECEDLDKGAGLEHLIEPGFKWPHLRELVIGGVDCDRQELMNVLETHSSTLQRLCLRDICLISTSWKKLLPEIRKNMFLVEACICGDLYGRDEDGEEPNDPFWTTGHLGPDLEYWDLSVPEVGDHEMRDSINVYCRFGGHLYPDEVPLTEEVVDKYYDDHVKGLFEDSDLEDDESDLDSLYLDGLGSTDISDSSQDGWEDVDSDEEISDDLENSNTEDASSEEFGLAVGMSDLEDAGTDENGVAIGMVESDSDDATDEEMGSDSDE